MCVKALTGVPTLLDALSPVWDAGGGVPWVDDVALVACGAVERLVAILRRAAGLRWRAERVQYCALEEITDVTYTHVVVVVVVVHLPFTEETQWVGCILH